MERVVSSYFAILGLSESAVTSIILAFFALLGTFAGVGYKYRTNKTKPEDNSKVLFDQVNAFIEQQKEDRENLRKELNELKVELDEVREDNKLKEHMINDLNRQLTQARWDNRELREELNELRSKLGRSRSKKKDK